MHLPPSSDAEPEAPERLLARIPKHRRMLLLRAGVAILGIGFLAFTLRKLGFQQTIHLLVSSGHILPIAFALEAARLFCEGMSARAVLGLFANRVPNRVIFPMQIVGHALMNTVPGGRAANEAIKASLVAPYVGTDRAISMAASNQANILLSSGIFSVPCAVAMWVLHAPTWLFLCLILHCLLLFGLGLTTRVLVTHPKLAAGLVERFPRFESQIHGVQSVAREGQLIQWWPVAWYCLGRGFQTAQYGLVALALGGNIDVWRALAAQGLYFVSAMVGGFVPGQFGSQEAIFALAKNILGLPTERAALVALLVHLQQLVWIALGYTMLAFWRKKKAILDSVEVDLFPE